METLDLVRKIRIKYIAAKLYRKKFNYLWVNNNTIEEFRTELKESLKNEINSDNITITIIFLNHNIYDKSLCLQVYINGLVYEGDILK